jgi:Na+/proline symporter
LVVYVGGMLVFGYLGQQRVKTADDFATARGGYGPWFLAFAFAATTASGATFLGLPGIAYDVGVSSGWYIFLYPVGVYGGVMLCMTLISRAGNSFGSRTIPEYLGDRYQSDALRILVAVFSLMLFFYLAGQLVSGLVMFETMLGLTPIWALIITCGVLLLYIMAGGAHADILTDGAQGMLMLALAIMILVLFISGGTIEGGLSGLMDKLEAQDANLVKTFNPDSVLVGSWWAIFAIIVSHAPLGLLPHIGNKLWALKDGAQRWHFMRIVFVMGMILPAIGLGGLIARALLGDALHAPGASSNEAIPALFIEIFPTWVAALLGVGILAAVMSTADGLVVSSSQVIANDLYRRTFAPRWHPNKSEDEIEALTLTISRWSTLGTLIISALLAWFLMNMNVALLVWVGVGGMMAALAGPLVLGTLWKGVTASGAIAGFITGAVIFLVTHSGAIDPNWFGTTGALRGAADWLAYQAPSPYSCAAMGEIASVCVTVLVSLRTQPVAREHLEMMFGTSS